MCQPNLIFTSHLKWTWAKSWTLRIKDMNVSAFHVSYKTATKASLIEKAAEKDRDSYTLRKRGKETEGKLTHGNKQTSNCYIY